MQAVCLLPLPPFDAPDKSLLDLVLTISKEGEEKEGGGIYIYAHYVLLHMSARRRDPLTQDLLRSTERKKMRMALHTA